MEIVRIGVFIFLTNLFCEKNVLVYVYCWDRWVEFFKKMSCEEILLWLVKIGGIGGHNLFLVIS
jgi:hypothetical protein